ncbi:MAG TPA: hypothetical protein V6D18_10315 [Thermosynechococcaceae cyanobacterium]
MPIRIKPIYRLAPCVLTFEDIQKIATLVDMEFPVATFSANDKIWEIYEETREPFLTAISQRDVLDLLEIKANDNVSGDAREVKIIFSGDEAKVTCMADPKHERWFEHFINDLERCIHPPTLLQLMTYNYRYQNVISTALMVALPISVSLSRSTPYCKIVIRQKPPDPFIENIKANIVSNIIWAVGVFVFGVLATVVTQQLLKK